MTRTPPENWAFERQRKRHGAPCKTCGGTIRYQSGPCVRCAQERFRKRAQAGIKPSRMLDIDRKREALASDDYYGDLID